LEHRPVQGRGRSQRKATTKVDTTPQMTVATVSQYRSRNCRRAGFSRATSKAVEHLDAQMAMM
jgi:hypothetical protein